MSRRHIVVAAAVVIVLCAAALGVLWTAHTRSADRLAERTTYVQAAREAVLNLTTINTTTVDADIERLRDSATGAFLDDFDSRSGDFTSAVTQSQVSTTGKIIEIGVESIGEDSAQLLVRAQSTVTNTSGAQNEPRNWRLRVTMNRTDNGILMSGVDFVA